QRPNFGRHFLALAGKRRKSDSRVTTSGVRGTFNPSPVKQGDNRERLLQRLDLGAKTASDNRNRTGARSRGLAGNLAAGRAVLATAHLGQQHTGTRTRAWERPNAKRELGRRFAGRLLAGQKTGFLRCTSGGER